MKRVINILLLLTFLIGYLEWGKGSHVFIFQAEADLFVKLVTDPLSVLHPLIIIPFLGQILILVSVFQQNPGRLLTLLGLGCLSIIILFLFFIGIISPNFRILISTVPFIVTAIFVLKYFRKRGV